MNAVSPIHTDPQGPVREEGKPPPPCNVEAEQALLGAAMVQNAIVFDVQSTLQPEDFFEPLHGRIWARLTELVNTGDTVSPVTLKPYFEADATMESLGGVGYLARLTSGNAGLLGARNFASQIKDLSNLRKLVEAAQQLIVEASDTSDSVDPLVRIEDMEERVGKILEGSQRATKPKIFATAIDDALDRLEAEAKGEVEGGTSLPDFTAWTAAVGKMRATETIILGGRPGMGKTTVAQRVALSTASQGIGTAFFSLEMSVDQMAQKMTVDECYWNGGGPSYDRMQAGDFTAKERAALKETRAKIADWPLYLDYCPGVKVSGLRARIGRVKKMMERSGYHLGLVIIDYIGLIHSDNFRAPPAVQISEISRELKAMSGQFECTNLVLAQLNRGVESRDDKRPMMSDLRDSGSLEQDAETVVFCYRPAYYLENMVPPKGDEKYNDWQAQLAQCRDDLHLIAAKRRHGKPGTQYPKFYGSYQAVRDSHWQRPTMDMEMEF